MIYILSACDVNWNDSKQKRDSLDLPSDNPDTILTFPPSPQRLAPDVMLMDPPSSWRPDPSDLPPLKTKDPPSLPSWIDLCLPLPPWRLTEPPVAANIHKKSRSGTSLEGQ